MKRTIWAPVQDVRFTGVGVIYLGKAEVKVSLQGAPLRWCDLVEDGGQQEGQDHSKHHEEDPRHALLGVVAVVLPFSLSVLLPEQQQALKCNVTSWTPESIFSEPQNPFSWSGPTIEHLHPHQQHLGPLVHYGVQQRCHEQQKMMFLDRLTDIASCCTGVGRHCDRIMSFSFYGW